VLGQSVLQPAESVPVGVGVTPRDTLGVMDGVGLLEGVIVEVGVQLEVIEGK
jgi:hypothetical protein